MNAISRIALVPCLAALGGLVLFFIPTARLIDSVYPGPHEGFTLMGIWLYIVVPGAAALGAAALGFYPRFAARGARHSSRFRLLAWAFLALLFAVALSCYRSAA